MLSVSVWRAESRTGLRSGLEEAFLREVALGLVEAEKKEKGEQEQEPPQAVEEQEPPATSSASAGDS